MLFFFKRDGDHRDLHGLTHSFPPRRVSDLRIEPAGEQLPDAARRGVDDDGLAALDLRAAFDQELGGRALEHQRGGARVIDGVGKPGEMFGRQTAIRGIGVACWAEGRAAIGLGKRAGERRVGVRGYSYSTSGGVVWSSKKN